MPFISQFNGKQPTDGPSRRVEKGAVENARKTLISVLEERFERIPAHAFDVISTIEDPQRLTLLMRSAVKVPTLNEFLALLASK
jgi:hypothetical protein